MIRRRRMLPTVLLAFVLCSFLTLYGSRRNLTATDWLNTAASTAQQQQQQQRTTSEASCSQQKSLPKEELVPVFYNLFVANEADSARVEQLVTQQLSHLLPEHHRVYMHSIGYPLLSIANVTLLEHHENGTEMLTLHSLWEYCQIQRTADSKVVYLHSKGSFHPKPENDLLRQFLTVGALSRECLHLPDQCNVCSSRMSPLPHPHTPGNMWLARCDYIQKLIDPKLFADRMETVMSIPHTPKSSSACYGRGRYAAEHWVHSHPLVAPCDLSDDVKYTWAYNNVPTSPKFTKRLKLAPRFLRKRYKHSRYCKAPLTGNQTFRVAIGVSLADRLEEYRQLYNASPTSDWWGWNFYHPDDVDDEKAVI